MSPPPPPHGNPSIAASPPWIPPVLPPHHPNSFPSHRCNPHYSPSLPPVSGHHVEHLIYAGKSEQSAGEILDSLLQLSSSGGVSYMQAAMPAVTHDDLSLRKAQERRAARSSGRAAVALVALSVLCGIVGFILCLAAEGSRSEASHYLMTVGGAGGAAADGQVDVCFYNSSGRAPLAFAIGAFLLLAVAMFAEHAYMLLAVAEGHPRVPSDPARLTWQTCCLFFVTWICFGLAEVMLMVGIAVESGHVSDWRKPRPVCHRVRPGVFAAAGILGLITVVVGFVVYVTALQTNKLRAQHPGGGGGYYVGYGMPQHHLQPPPPMPHGPHPHPPPPATAPSAPEITPAACQVQPSRAACVTKQCADAV